MLTNTLTREDDLLGEKQSENDDDGIKTFPFSISELEVWEVKMVTPENKQK